MTCDNVTLAAIGEPPRFCNLAAMVGWLRNFYYAVCDALGAGGGGGSTAIPAGVMMDFGGTTAPTGYLLCDGAAVSRTAYSALFAAIGTAWGAGDGVTTFNLPDKRGRVSIGLDNMGGASANRVVAVAADSVGGSGGTENHTLVTGEMPSHSHTVNIRNGTGSTSCILDNTGDALAVGVGTVTAYTTPTTGGGGAHNNMQPYVALNQIIKY